MLDWHFWLAISGYAASMFIFVWRMGLFTGELKSLVETMKEDVALGKTHTIDIADLKARVNNLEKRKR